MISVQRTPHKKISLFKKRFLFSAASVLVTLFTHLRRRRHILELTFTLENANNMTESRT